MRIPRICLIILLTIIFCSVAHGQGVASGDLRVSVKDPHGRLVGGANVIVRD